MHAVGLLGPEGAGLAAREGVAADVTVVMGTLAKGFGTIGGYIAGPAALVDTVRTFARSFSFTTSLPPAGRMPCESRRARPGCPGASGRPYR